MNNTKKGNSTWKEIFINFFYKIHSYFDNIEGQQIKSHDGYQIMIYQIQPKDPHVPKGGKWLFF